MNAARLVFVICSFAGLLIAQGPIDSGPPAPTPEPATVVLLGVGLAGIGYVAWRRNRKR